MSEIEVEPELASLLAELTDDDRARVPPPPEIWSGIVAEIAGNDGEDGDPNDGEVRSLSVIQPDPEPPPHRIWGRPWLPVAAAVAIAVAGGLVTWAVSDRTVDKRTDEVVASVEIRNDGLPVANDEAAEATLLRVDDQYVLELDVPELPTVDGYFEVWIIDSAVDGMFSLGVVTGDGRFTLPPGVDPANFPIVDVSVEAADGNPTHGGQSIWRGVLDL